MAPYFLKNVTEYTDLSASVTGMSNAINDGTTEALQEVQDRIHCFAIRLNLDDDPVDGAESVFAKMVGAGKIVTSTAPAYTQGKIYVVNTDLVSGLYGHIGILLLVKYAYGVEVEGYGDINKVINDLQTWTGVDMIEDGEYIFFQFNSDGSHTDLVFAEP